MIDSIVRMTRYGVLVFWIAFALSLTGIIPPPYDLVIAWIAVFVLLVHFAQYLLIKFRFIDLASTEVSFLKTMLLGFTYWVPLMNRDVSSSEVVQRQTIGHHVHDVIDNDHEPS